MNDIIEANTRTKIRQAFIAVASHSVATLFMLVIAFLTLAAVASTCYMKYTLGDADGERTFFLQDSIFLNIAVIFLFCLFIYQLVRMHHFQTFLASIENDTFFRKCQRFILLILCMLACIWVATTAAIPAADQQAIQAAVILAQKDDWSLFEPGEYMSRYPHQFGFFWISMLFATIFGKYTSAFFQVFNIAGVLIICKTLGMIAARMGASRFQQLATMSLCVIFYPLIQYTTFVYGVIWGLALALLALRFEMDFFETHHWSPAAASAFCITLSILFKSNFQIFLIGMVLYAFIEIIYIFKIRKALIIIFITMGLVATSLAPTAAVEKASNIEIAGMSSWSWIAMGLQDGPRAPGWFNSYVRNSYKEAEYDTERHAEIAKKDIAHSFADFMSGKRDASKFFMQKIVSQWNNPSFQGSWIIQGSRAAFPVHKPIAAFLDAQGTYAAISWYLNPLHILIYMGVLCWIATSNWRKPQFYKQLILALIFLGGFFCHIFWEAKSQYAMPYFVIIFPYAAMGYAQFVRMLQRYFHRKQNAKFNQPQIVLGATTILIAIILTASGLTYITGDEKAYSDWLGSNPKCSYLSEEPFLQEALDFAG